jgi:kynurenine formamidase
MAADIAGYHRWTESLAAQCRIDPDPRGTAGKIDPAARLRAAHAVARGQTIGLGRPLADERIGRGDEIVTVTPTFVPEWGPLDGHATLGVGLDRVEYGSHGYDFTHVDAFNHLGINGAAYGGRSLSDDRLDITALAGPGIFTRGLFADIPAARGSAWVDADQPVTGEDIDRALGSVEFIAGDALLLYMGRDRFEAAGWSMTDATNRPGVGADGARWLVEHQVAVLAWDFLDAIHPGEPEQAVHRLVPAIGQVLIDNCDFSRATPAFRQTPSIECALAVAPMAFPHATGSLVDPFVVV